MLGLHRRLEGADHFGTQGVALAFKLQSRQLRIASGHAQPRSALAAQLEHLTDADRGGLRAVAGVFDLPAQLGVGQHSRLASFTFGDIDAPTCDRQLRIVGLGGSQGIVEGQHRALGQCHRGQGQQYQRQQNAATACAGPVQGAKHGGLLRLFWSPHCSNRGLSPR
ncbi:hypothetical protein D3C72_1881930 [compost metagenome]